MYGLDSLGFGHSEKPPLSYNQYLWRDQFVDFIMQTVDERALMRDDNNNDDNDRNNDLANNDKPEKIIIVGNSIGGFTAASAAAALSLLNSSNQISKPSDDSKDSLNDDDSNNNSNKYKVDGLVLINSAGRIIDDIGLTNTPTSDLFKAYSGMSTINH